MRAGKPNQLDVPWEWRTEHDDVGFTTIYRPTTIWAHIWHSRMSCLPCDSFDPAFFNFWGLENT